MPLQGYRRPRSPLPPSTKVRLEPKRRYDGRRGWSHKTATWSGWSHWAWFIGDTEQMPIGVHRCPSADPVISWFNMVQLVSVAPKHIAEPGMGYGTRMRDAGKARPRRLVEASQPSELSNQSQTGGSVAQTGRPTRPKRFD